VCSPMCSMWPFTTLVPDGLSMQMRHPVPHLLHGQEMCKGCKAAQVHLHTRVLMQLHVGRNFKQPTRFAVRAIFEASTPTPA
jgi:hypothetical protein